MSATAQRTVRRPPPDWIPASVRDRRGRAIFLLGGAISLFLVLVLWLHGGGLRNVATGPGGALTSAGRLSGLIAADLLVIQVVTMARIPWVERVFGQDQLARCHRYTGFTSFNLVLVHILLITLGYASNDHAGVLGEAWNLITTYPGMLLATAGTVALIMVVVTSLRAARRRLRYESWHLLHLYAYLGIGLALPHQIWTGQDFVLTAAARLYWWTLYIASAGSVLVFRVGMPLWRSLRHDLRIAAIVPETYGVTSVYLSGRDLDRLPVQSGQFFNWRFLSGAGWMRAHPYSLSAAPRPDLFRITIKHLGDDSSRVPALRVGTRVLFEGPYGRLTGLRRERHRLTLIACGIGITPMRALIETEYYRPGDAILIYRARTPSDFTFYREIEEIAQARGVVTVYLPGPRGPAQWLPEGYRDGAAALRHLAPAINDSDVFV